MLSEKEISEALHANRVVRVDVKNPHGPLGLEQLAEAVRRIQTDTELESHQVQRPITLPAETWTKLDNLARELGKKQSQRVTPSDVITALVIQGLDAAENR